MVWYNVTPHVLYQSLVPTIGDARDPLVRARAWVEAVYIYDVYEKINEWWKMIETGEAFERVPDPTWQNLPGRTPLTQAVADKFIGELDADFLLERNRFDGKKPPDFHRLPPAARFAFVQEVSSIQLSEKEIETIAQARLAAGEQLPPPKNAQTEEVLSRKGTPPPNVPPQKTKKR
jgi:hypothetical protein